MSEKFDEITNLDRIEFTLFGNEEIKRSSAVFNDTFGINIAETYDLNEPKRGGLVDPRLGTTDSQMLCATCGLEYKYCPGHFGHTELAEPVFHIGFINIVKNILGCVCIRCSKLLLNKSLDEINTVIRNKYGKVRFAEVRKLTSSIKYCQRQDYSCGAPVPIITKKLSPTQGTIHLQAETELSGVSEEDGGGETGKKRIIEILKPKTIYTIMKNISDLDYQIMGFDTAKARPEDMIIINFPIPPNAIRPAAKRDFLSTTSFEDTLTHKLSDIVKSNIKVRKLLDKETASGEDIKYSDEYIRNLQYHVATYYNNEEVSLPISQQKTGGRPIKSITERISGKTGRIRQNLNGKRVEGSGRAVITSDPSMGIDEVGIPLKIAMSIPFPETVTPDNYEKLSLLVKNGRDIYPGVNKVIKKNGVSYDIRYRNRPIKLQYGDVVERHLVDGDYVLFNRQPSLHKLSMMGHRVRVSLNPKFTTFSMNPSTCKPYNADFDGDEMNVFVPQTIQSVVELSMLANVTSLIVSPRNTEPIIELRQDSVLGSYLFTETDQELTWNRIMKTLMVTKNLNFDDVKKMESSTFELMSHLIPDINLSMGGVKVENGKYISGKVTSKILNNSNGFIGILYDQYSSDITRDFIDNVQKVVLSFLYKKGFTVGIKDCVLENKILSEIKDKTNKLLLEVKHLITEQENHPGLLDENIFENNMATMLSAHAGNMGKIAMDNINHDNNFYIMVNSGAKGKVESIGHIACIVGQINMNNKRIAKKVNNRTLAHYAQYDDTPHARGFITSSYVKGLRPAEFFFLTMAGRDGLIDTAIKTADTGYIQRKFIKGMEDVMVYYDGLVRSANNQIIQYFYGGSNLDQVKQKPVKISIIGMSNDKVRENFVFTKDELKSMFKKSELLKIEPMNEKYYKKLIDYRDELRQIVMRATGNYVILKDEFMLPINLHRIINSKLGGTSSSKDIVEYDEVINTIEEIIKSKNTKMFCMKESERNQETNYKQDLENTNKFLFIISIYEYLSPKKCIVKYKLTKKALEEIKNEIIHNFNKAIVDPGEMVGVLGAQSMGEKSTQLNLNTKHSAGAVKKGTSGVARMNEILRCTKNIKTPMLTVYLTNDYKYSKESAYKIASYISYLTLQDIVLKGDIGYDPDILNGYLKEDNIDVKTALQIYDTKLDLKKLPWMFRFTINRDMLYAKKLKLSEIKINFVKFWKSKLVSTKINNKIEKDIYSRVVSCAILSSTENDPEPVIHIRFELNNYDVNKIIELQDYILSNFNLKGLDGITGIDVIPQSLVEIQNDGSVELKEQYILSTDGINMSGIRGILGIDHTKTITNDMYSIYANFGIEAVRNKLINEITELIDNVNYHHISLLVDVMTHSGSLISIDRHGINRQDTDPLSRASFEKTMEQFINAAAFNEIDRLKSVSSRIIIGRMINGGTGYCQLMMDNDILENTELNVSTIQQGLSQTDDVIKLEDNMIIDDLIMKESEMFIV
jgi:DNA-directed RNA polymerase II subunit RPB1